MKTAKDERLMALLKRAQEGGKTAVNAAGFVPFTVVAEKKDGTLFGLLMPDLEPGDEYLRDLLLSTFLRQEKVVRYAVTALAWYGPVGDREILIASAQDDCAIYSSYAPVERRSDEGIKAVGDYVDIDTRPRLGFFVHYLAGESPFSREERNLANAFLKTHPLQTVQQPAIQ